MQSKSVCATRRRFTGLQLRVQRTRDSLSLSLSLSLCTTIADRTNDLHTLVYSLESRLESD